MTHFLIYTSSASAGFKPSDVGSILLASRRNNQPLGITGALFYRGGNFLQILEGMEEALAMLTDTIKADPRHGNYCLLIEGEKPTADFSNWSMAEISEQAVERAPLVADALDKTVLSHDEAIALMKQASFVCE